MLNKYKDLVTSESSLGRFYGTASEPHIYPSVSTVLHNTVHQPGLIEYYKNNTRKSIETRLAETSDVGTQLHKCFDDIVWGRKASPPAGYQQHCDLFYQWTQVHKVKPTVTEIVIASDKYGFAGRLDFLGEIDGKMEIADWKTGSQFGDTWGPQVAAYQLAVCEMMGIPDNSLGFRIVHIPREAPRGNQPKPYTHYRWMHTSFLARLRSFKDMPRFSQLKKINYHWLMHEELRTYYQEHPL